MTDYRANWTIYVNLMLVLLFFYGTAKAQNSAVAGKNEVTISDAWVTRENRTLIIDYSIDLGENVTSCDVELLMSVDGGRSFDLVALTDKVKGDIGRITSSGKKQIVYDIDSIKERLVGKELAFQVKLKNKYKHRKEKIGNPRLFKNSLSTNLVEWANFATVNLDASFRVSQHISLFIGGKYNPWKFETKGGMSIFENQTTAYAGMRYWPRFVYSGWWIGAKLKYMDFSESGVLRPKLFEGKSLGAGVSFGYTWMIHERFNVEIGGGIWGGRHLAYSKYRTPAARDLIDSGAKNFVFIDDLSISLIYLF